MLKKISKSLVFILAATCSNVYADNNKINSVYSFGDSLSDTGTFSQTIKLLLSPNIDYRFTNNNPNGSSRVWAEVLSNRLGVSLIPNVINPTYIGGGAYAQGGARVSKSDGPLYPPFLMDVPVPVTMQVDRLLAQSPRLGANDLVMFWAGANDGFVNFQLYKSSTDSSPALTNMANEAKILSSSIQRVRDAGAKYIVALTVPDLAKTPRGFDPSLTPEQRRLYSALSQSFNAQLFESAPSAGGLVIDVNKLLGDVINQPTQYGFNPNVYAQTACDGGFAGGLSLVCLSDNPNNYLFADFVHPSTQGHALISQYVFSVLQAIPQAQALLISPLQQIRQQGLSLESRLNMQALSDGKGNLRQIGAVHVYGGPQVDYFDYSSQNFLSSVRSTSANLDVGADWMVSRNAVLGVALSYGEASAQFGGQSGQLKTNTTLGTLYTTIALSQNWFISASASYGAINHSDFTRQLKLPTTTLTASSSPGGYYASGRIGLGWNGKIGPGSGGPYLGYTSEKVTVDSFTEKNSPISMSFGNMSYTAQRLTMGAFWMQDQSIGKLSVFGRAAVDYDLTGNDVNVSLGPTAQALTNIGVSQLPRTSFNASIGVMLPTSDSSLWTLQAGLRGAEGFQAYSAGVFYRKAF